MHPLRIFLGYDKREAIGFHTCVQSLIETSSVPLDIRPVWGERRDGTNDFIYQRFLVPFLCDFDGWAIFADGSDMLFMQDVQQLWALRGMYPVSVVKRDYKTRHATKYKGTPMESPNRDYPRKNWSSLILFNCGHPANRLLTPEFVAKSEGAALHRFAWLNDSMIGSIPKKWNVLIGEEGEGEECAVAHFTLGIPAMKEYSNCLYWQEWFQTQIRSQRVG